MKRVPGEAADLLLVAPEALHLRGHVANVKELDEVVARGGQQPVAVRIPPHVGHRVLVGVSGRIKKEGIRKSKSFRIAPTYSVASD